MTQAEKIAKILEWMELMELAIVSNDRQRQIELARQASEIRRLIA